MQTNDSATGFFHACDWHDNIQLIVGFVTKGHPFSMQTASKNLISDLTSKQKFATAKRSKKLFIQECDKKPDLSNFVVIFLLVSVALVAIFVSITEQFYES